MLNSSFKASVPGQSEEVGDRVKVDGECQARSSPTNVSSLQDLSQPRDGVGRPVWWSQRPGADRLGGGARWGEGAPGDTSAATYEDLLGAKKSTANPK